MLIPWLELVDCRWVVTGVALVELVEGVGD